MKHFQLCESNRRMILLAECIFLSAAAWLGSHYYLDNFVPITRMFSSKGKLAL